MLFALRDLVIYFFFSKYLNSTIRKLTARMRLRFVACVTGFIWTDIIEYTKKKKYI